MNLLQSLKQLRDDIKSWVTVNLNAINTKVEQNTIHVDSELNPASTNPIQNKAIAEELRNLSTEITNKPGFSGDYNDLTNAPNIIEDESGDMIIADDDGNVIFKADSDGMHTTALTLDGEPAATEKYVNDKIDVVNTKVDNIKIPEVDLSNHYTKEETDAAINSAKEELSESITTESSEWKVVDEAGNIIFSVDNTGAHTTTLTLDGKTVEEIATDKAKAEVAALVDSSPGALDTLNEFADALGNDPNFATTITNKISEKVDKVEGKDLSTNDFTDAYKQKLDGLNLDNITYEETDPTVPNWAKEPNKPTYTAEEVGLGNVDNTSDADKPISTATQTALDELKEEIMFESQEWHIVDENDNIVFSVDASGAHTTNLTLDGEPINDIINGKVEELSNTLTTKIQKKQNVIVGSEDQFVGFDKDGNAVAQNIPTDLATQEFVTTKINEAQLAGGEVDLSVYYTKSEVDTAINAAQADIKADAVFKILGSDPNSFAIKVNASDNKTIIQALGEAGAGLYTLYVQKGVSDNPTGDESSCHGICCVNTWYNAQEYYAWMILFDSDGNAYSRYMSAYGASEWQKITPDLSAFYTKTEIDELIPDWALATEKPTYTADEVGALSEDTTLANLVSDENHRTVSDAEKDIWNNKSDFKGNYSELIGAPDPTNYYTKTEVDEAISKVDLSDYALSETVDAHIENTAIHVTENDKIAWNAKSNFSGDYNDLTNAPNITEDESNNLVIADPNGNIIFRSDGNGFETTTLTAQSITLNGINVEENLNAINTLLNVTEADNGKVLMVVDGRLQLTTINN